MHSARIFSGSNAEMANFQNMFIFLKIRPFITISPKNTPELFYTLCFCYVSAMFFCLFFPLTFSPFVDKISMFCLYSWWAANLQIQLR